MAAHKGTGVDLSTARITVAGAEAKPMVVDGPIKIGKLLPQETFDEAWKRVEEKAGRLGLRIDEHPEGTMLWICRLWIGDRLLDRGRPLAEVDAILTGIYMGWALVANGDVSIKVAE